MPTTILIVDDTLAGRETLRALLTSSDYQLEFANDGPQALFQAARLNPDLILLDVMMPGMDGFEVCRRLRADRSLAEVPIIMVTALDDRESRLHGIEAGADDFISKPFDRAELRARVRTITRLNRYRQLVTERTQFEWVVDQADDGYVIVNDDDDVLYANARARWLLSGSTDPLGGTFIALAQQHYHCEPDVVWAGWPAQAEIELVRERYLVRPESPGAHAVWLAVTILNLPAGPQSRRLIRLRDVTAQMTTQREIWSFHALIAHKLRTPLLSISIGIEMLTMPGARLSPADIADAAYSAQRSIQRLRDELDDIIRYVEAPAIAADDGGFALAELPDLIARLSVELQLEHVTAQPDPALAGRYAVLNVTAIELIVRELLDNAQKFHPRHAPRIDVIARRSDDSLTLRVVDDGGTLTPEQLSRVWLPYYQAEKDFTGQTQGMGLGLSMVASLVWNVGGTCRMFNRDDQPGIVAEISIPLH